MSLPLAFDVTLDNLGLLIPIVAIVVPMLIPIVAILTKHQHRMAMLYRENSSVDRATMTEIQAMREEMRQLRALVHQQTIAMDDFRQALANPGVEPNIGDRLTQGAGQ